MIKKNFFFINEFHAIFILFHYINLDVPWVYILLILIEINIYIIEIRK